jgi:hypothetical protein
MRLRLPGGSCVERLSNAPRSTRRPKALRESVPPVESREQLVVEAAVLLDTWNSEQRDKADAKEKGQVKRFKGRKAS